MVSDYISVRRIIYPYSLTILSSTMEVPEDVLLIVWSYLDAQGLCSIARTCHRHNLLSSREEYWAALLSSSFNLHPNSCIIQNVGTIGMPRSQEELHNDKNSNNSATSSIKTIYKNTYITIRELLRGEHSHGRTKFSSTISFTTVQLPSVQPLSQG